MSRLPVLEGSPDVMLCRYVAVGQTQLGEGEAGEASMMGGGGTFSSPLTSSTGAKSLLEPDLLP